MAKSSFREQPLVVKAAVFITFVNAWVLFEELVIDGHGLWQYVPLYKVGLFCVWDVLALAVIGLSLFLRVASPQQSQGQTSTPRCHVRWCPVC
ncbi:MAG: hypothetical protein H0W86_13430 [Armatimonadetes bacterium]|nr:hypothetical protein [Armatimonadota bacterium]